MKDRQIANPDDLDLILRTQQHRQDSRLWREASGQHVRWYDLLGLGCGLLLMLTGLFDQAAADSNATIQTFAGFFFLLFMMWTHMQRQINALATIVKRLEAEASRAS